jgi:hypothetical protein
VQRGQHLRAAQGHVHRRLLWRRRAARVAESIRVAAAAAGYRPIVYEHACQGCPTVLTPWSGALPIGPLPAGSYGPTVEVYLIDRCRGDSPEFLGRSLFPFDVDTCSTPSTCAVVAFPSRPERPLRRLRRAGPTGGGKAVRRRPGSGRRACRAASCSTAPDCA